MRKERKRWLSIALCTAMAFTMTGLSVTKSICEKLEITSKSKSDKILGVKCKLENNIKVNINDYDSYCKLFSSLGYYSYVEIYKERIVYQLKSDMYVYNVMIDNLKERIMKETGYTLTFHNMMLDGICNTCNKNKTA